MRHSAAWLEVGDQLASMVGAAASLVALTLAVLAHRTGRRNGAADPTARRTPWLPLAALATLAVLAVLGRLVPGLPPTARAIAGWLLPLVVGTTLVMLWLHRTRHRSGPTAGVRDLLHAQSTDDIRHRYQFFEQQKPPALADIYVRQRAAPTADSTDGPDPAATRSMASVLGQHEHLLVIGAAGAGKSTLAARISMETARAALAGQRRPVVAVTVPAVDLVDRSLPEAMALACRRDLHVTLDPPTFTRPPGHRGVWRVLVDGLDEVVDTDARVQLLWRLRGLVDRDDRRSTSDERNRPAGPYRFVITCRPLADSELAELRRPAVGAYELRPFDRAELDEFAHRWFTARRPDDVAAARAEAARFLAQVAGARLGPVARVPLLATIAALVYEQHGGGALPSSRAALYDRFIEHLLDGRRTLARFRHGLDPVLLDRGGAGEALAGWLATDFHGIVGGLLDAVGSARVADPQADLTDVAARWLAAHAPHDPQRVIPDGQRTVRDLLLSTGLFVFQRGRIAFGHHSFAEYFCARAEADQFDEERWRSRVANPAARSLAGFAATRRPDADRLIRELIDDPVAAGELLADGVPVSGHTRTLVVKRLVARLRNEHDSAPECLRVLRELSIDADVLGELMLLSADDTVDPWTRLVVADAVADVDHHGGVRLLHRILTGSGDSAVRDWAADALQGRGVPPDLTTRTSLAAAARRTGTPLGRFGQEALHRVAADAGAGDRQRVTAAEQLAAAGDLRPLRALVTQPGLAPASRVAAAAALADLGDPRHLRRLARPVDEWADEHPVTTLEVEGPRSGVSVYVDGYRDLEFRLRACVALRDRRHPETIGLLRALADDCAGRLMIHDVAAMLAEDGDRTLLIRLLSGDVIQTVVPAGAARLLVRLGTVPELRAVAHAPRATPEARVWSLLGLRARGEPVDPDDVGRLLRHRRLSQPDRIALLLGLAEAGDVTAHRQLRREACTKRHDVRRRLIAAVALAHLGDEAGGELFRSVVTARHRSTTIRVTAAAELTRLDRTAGLPLLRALAAAPHHPNLRTTAAHSLARRFGEPDALRALVVDSGLPLRYRQLAVEYLAATGKVDQEPPQREVHDSYAPTEPIRTDPGERPSPGDDESLVALLDDPATPPRLRNAVAANLLPPEAARQVLGAVAADPRVTGTQRWAAASTLIRVDLHAGRKALRAVLRDRRVGFLLRVYIHWHAYEWATDLFDDPANAALRARLERFDARRLGPLRPLLVLWTIARHSRPA